MKKSHWIFLWLFLLLLGSTFIWFRFLASPQSKAAPEIVSFKGDTEGTLVVNKLKTEGFIRSETALNLTLNLKGRFGKFQAGGYRLSKSMNTFEIADALIAGPQLKWAIIIPGLRKEQIAEKLADKFGWKASDIEGFLNAYTKIPNALAEGNYYPDTYLIPIDESGEEVGIRLIKHFNEAFAPLATGFLEQNIKYDTAIKIASLVQREAAGPTDMSLIAGVIWNRLLKGMLLQIDASNQYTLGKPGNWWPHVDPSDLKADSLYNLYLHKGLPPTPIANPGLDAIKAVLNPEETDCFFYLHDRERQIHCSVTYQEHLQNIAKYLQ